MSKIILIHPQAGIDWKNNSSVFAIELARRLDNYFEVELISGAECGSFSRPINSLGRSNSWLNSWLSTLANRWSQQPKMAIDQITSFLPCISYLINHPADLILPHNGYAGLLAATCARGINQTPILFTHHNGVSNGGKELERNLTLRPDRLITLNPSIAQDAQRLAPKQTINTIPLGVDLSEFIPEGQVMTTGLAKPCVIAVAPLDRHGDQRIELTIEAVSRLPQASLLICGEGGDHDYFQDLGDRLLGKERFQIRAFAYAQMPQVYRSGNIFTSAASQVPCGLKYIEAMACGLPVVTTDNDSHRYLIGNGGITCDVTNLDAYAEALQSAIAMGWHLQQPRQNALRFGWQGITLLYYQAALKTISTYERQLFSGNPHESIN